MDAARAALSVHIRVAFVYDPYTNFCAALIDAHCVVVNMGHGLEF